MDASCQPPVGTIALLFTDIEGSTRLATALGSAWAGVLADHHELVGAAISAEGGFVEGTAGDAFREQPVQRGRIVRASPSS